MMTPKELEDLVFELVEDYESVDYIVKAIFAHDADLRAELAASYETNNLVCEMAEQKEAGLRAEVERLKDGGRSEQATKPDPLVDASYTGQIATLKSQLTAAEERVARLEEALKPLSHRGGAMKIIAICGSTRFIDGMSFYAWELEKNGHMVFTPRLLPHDRPGLDGAYAPESHAAEAAGVKALLDAVYFKKIELSDEVFVYNQNGYIGESTRNEINHAHSLGKPVRYLEPQQALTPSQPKEGA